MTTAIIGEVRTMEIINPSRRIASSAIHFFNETEATAHQLMSALSDKPDEEVWEIRRRARTFGRMAWRIECACDAVIMDRESGRRGRLKAEEGKGVDAAVKKHAAEIGVHPQTIYQNAAIHKTFFATSGATSSEGVNGSLDALEDREFYRAAMSTGDPHATIEKFAQEKLKNPSFSTRDAWRDVKEKKAPPLDETVPALCDEPEVAAAWEEFQNACGKLVTAAPRLNGLVGGYLEEIQYELTLPPQTVEQTIFDLLIQGYDEADHIAARMKRDRIHVIVWLNRLCEIGRLESFEKERAPGARGAARTGYRAI